MWLSESNSTCTQEGYHNILVWTCISERWQSSVFMPDSGKLWCWARCCSRAVQITVLQMLDLWCQGFCLMCSLLMWAMTVGLVLLSCLTSRFVKGVHVCWRWVCEYLTEEMKLPYWIQNVMQRSNPSVFIHRALGLIFIGTEHPSLIEIKRRCCFLVSL